MEGFASNCYRDVNLRRILCASVAQLGRRLAGEAPMKRGVAMRVRVQPRFWMFVIATTFVVFAVSFGVLQHRFNEGSRQLREVRAYRDSLRVQADAATDRLEYARTDAYIERVARDELGMIMPGEVRYVNGAR